MKNPKINQKIIDLWSKYFKPEDNVKIPAFYSDAEQGGILFIGMNPAASNLDAKEILKDSIIFSDETIDNLFDYSYFLKYKDRDELVDFLIETEKGFFYNSHPFFKPFADIANENNTFFQHIDLFQYRKTSMNDFMELVIEKESDQIEFTDFGKDSIEIFKELFAQYNSKVIVVPNAKASKIFKQLYKDDLVWNEEKGCHLFKNNTPIFFSSMLAGMAALDVHSRERLCWHIRQSFN